MIERLRAVHPVFSHWYDRETCLDSSVASFEHVLTRIEAGVYRDQEGNPTPDLGYIWHGRNTSNDGWGPRYLSAMASAGGDQRSFFNSLSLQTDPFHVAAPDIVACETIRGALLVIAESFEADEAIAYPASLIDHWPDVAADAPRLRLAWISYVAPKFTHLVVPPATAIVERRPDGGLLMAATKETFQVDDPAHLAVARDILAGASAFRTTSAGR